MSTDTPAGLGANDSALVAEARANVSPLLDDLVAGVLACDCGARRDALHHFELVGLAAVTQWSKHPAVLASMLAEAVTRLAAREEIAEDLTQTAYLEWIDGKNGVK